MLKRLFTVTAAALALLVITGTAAQAAGPCCGNLNAGYVGFWEHNFYQGVASRYYMPTGGACITLPHGAGQVGDKVSSWWSYAPGKEIRGWTGTQCTGLRVTNFRYNQGDGDPDTFSEDTISSFRVVNY
jgi:hypothetical protein